MGLVLRFPLERRRAAVSSADRGSQDGQILVLPVVRIEHHEAVTPDTQAAGSPAAAPDAKAAGSPPRGDKPRRGRKSA
jgi:hypothetical protein